MQVSYPIPALRQVVREGPPAPPAPTLAELKDELAWWLDLRDAAARHIRVSEAFLRANDLPRPVAAVIAASVAESRRVLAEVLADIAGVQRDIDQLETALFGWRSCPSDPNAIP